MLFFCFLLVPNGIFGEADIDEDGGQNQTFSHLDVGLSIIKPFTCFPDRGELVGSWRSVTGDTAFKATHLYKYQDVCMSVLANIQQRPTNILLLPQGNFVSAVLCTCPVSFQNSAGNTLVMTINASMCVVLLILSSYHCQGTCIEASIWQQWSKLLLPNFTENKIMAT